MFLKNGNLDSCESIEDIEEKVSRVVFVVGPNPNHSFGLIRLQRERDFEAENFLLPSNKEEIYLLGNVWILRREVDPAVRTLGNTESGSMLPIFQKRTIACSTLKK